MSSNYSYLLNISNALYETMGYTFPFTHYSNAFFSEAKKTNPSVARMALQQASVDYIAGAAFDLQEGFIDKAEYSISAKNNYDLTYFMHRHPKMGELEEDLKKMYPKTARKRLALLPCIMDSDENGLAAVKKKVYKGMTLTPANDIIENKLLKRFQYFLRRFVIK